MIEHIVLFRWQDGTSPEAIAAVIAALEEMQGQIPGIVSLSCGTDFSGRSQGYSHGLVVRFADRAGLEAYQPHPVHQAIVVNQIKPIVADVLAMDYEFQKT